MNRRDILKGMVAVAGTSMVPATAYADSILPIVESEKLKFVYILPKNGMLADFATFNPKTNTYSLIFYNIEYKAEDIIESMDMKEYISKTKIIYNKHEIACEDRAKQLFDSMPHNHPRGHIPDWNHQPQFIKDVFMKRAKG